MSEQRGLSSEQKQKLKKYAVFALMAIVFAGCMWLIFAPSDADKAKGQEGIGLNADIPDPDGGGLIGDKKDAYEQEQIKNKQKDRMQSLQGYMDILEGKTKDKQQVSLSLVDEPGQQSSAKPQEEKAPIGSSVSAYKDINKTLGNFYEQPKADPEKEEMKKKLEELEAKMSEKETTKSQMDEQLELMEKSYQMAAKYMPNGQQGNRNESLSKRISNGTVKNNNGKTKVAPIRQIQNQTVSTLSQRLSDEDYFLMYDQPRNTSFNTMGGEMGISEKNTISAVIHADLTVVDGRLPVYA